MTWTLIPIIITLLALGLAWAVCANPRGEVDLTPLIAVPAALVVSLIAWLIYFIIE